MDSNRSPRNSFWAENENDEDEDGLLGTPTRGRRRGGGGGSANRITGSRTTNGDGTPNRFVRGVIPMPSPALLFSGQQTPAAGGGGGGGGGSLGARPPNSTMSVFGSAGRSVEGVIGGGGLTSSLGLAAEYAEFEGGVMGAMESGAGAGSGTVRAFREFAAMHSGGGGSSGDGGRGRENGRHDHGHGHGYGGHDENEDVRMRDAKPSSMARLTVNVNGDMNGMMNSKVRRFKSSGIRLRGMNEVTFPLSALNGPATGSSWGPAGFGGYGNEGHVMKRGFGLVYYGQGAPDAAGLNGGEDEEGGGGDGSFGGGAGSARRSRFRRAEEEEMEVDGAEESE